MNRIQVKVVPSFLGNCFILTDTHTSKTVEVMSIQLQGIARSTQSMGSLPHANWIKEGDVITIYHDDDREDHEVSFTMDEFKQAMDKSQGQNVLPLVLTCPTCQEEFTLQDESINELEDTYGATLDCPNEACQTILYSHEEKGLIVFDEYMQEETDGVWGKNGQTGSIEID